MPGKRNGRGQGILQDMGTCLLIFYPAETGIRLKKIRNPACGVTSSSGGGRLQSGRITAKIMLDANRLNGKDNLPDAP